MRKVLTVATCLFTCSLMHAQGPLLAGYSTSLSNLPDAALPNEPAIAGLVRLSSLAADPSVVATSTPTIAAPQQTKRILWIVPNFRSVSADTKLPPQTAKEKFTIGFQDSFDYSSFIFVGAQAGISQASDSYPAFHQGAPNIYFRPAETESASPSLSN